MLSAIWERRLALKTGQIKPHFAGNRNGAVYPYLRRRIFAQSPIDPAKFTAIIPPVDGGCAHAPELPAPVAELVDAADSKSVSLSEWEFDSPRGHHRPSGLSKRLNRARELAQTSLQLQFGFRRIV